MKRIYAVTLMAVASIAGCTKEDNPLLRATDGQFARLVEPRTALAPSCAAAFYDPDLFVRQYNAVKFMPETRIFAVSPKEEADCVVGLQKRASELGIEGNVTEAHIRDDRVRRRYVATRKK